MESRDRKELMNLLTELISAQDDVTHANEHRLVNILQGLIAKRNGIRNQIITFVESLVAQEPDP